MKYLFQNGDTERKYLLSNQVWFPANYLHRQVLLMSNVRHPCDTHILLPACLAIGIQHHRAVLASIQEKTSLTVVQAVKADFNQELLQYGEETSVPSWAQFQMQQR